MSDDPKPPVIVKLNPERKEYIRAENEFLRAIGECVTSWAFVDRQLFRLFRFGLQTTTHRAATVYYKQRSLQQRIQFVADILKQQFTADEYEDVWKPLEKEIEELLPTRNIIVHHPSKRTGTSKNGNAIYIYAIHIEPYERILNREYKGLKGKTELGIDDLKRHTIEVGALEMGLRSLARALGAQFPPHR